MAVIFVSDKQISRKEFVALTKHLIDNGWKESIAGTQDGYSGLCWTKRFTE